MILYAALGHWVEWLESEDWIGRRFSIRLAAAEQEEFAEAVLDGRTIRHRVAGMENNTTNSVMPPGLSFESFIGPARWIVSEWEAAAVDLTDGTVAGPSGRRHAVELFRSDLAAWVEGVQRRRRDASAQQAKAASRVDVEAECQAWLVSLMEASPNKPTLANAEILAHAKVKWPGISNKAVERAKAAAVAATNAESWKAGGAPRKPPRRTS